MGRFHPILPLSVTDGIHSEPVMHLCRELTDPQQVLQYRWHGSSLLPGAPIGDQDGIGQVTRAWHAGIQDAHASSIPHMLLTIACLLSLGMPWMPPGRGIWEITSPLMPSWLPITRPLFPPRLWISGAICPLWLSGHYLAA